MTTTLTPTDPKQQIIEILGRWTVREQWELDAPGQSDNEFYQQLERFMRHYATNSRNFASMNFGPTDLAFFSGAGLCWLLLEPNRLAEEELCWLLLELSHLEERPAQTLELKWKQVNDAINRDYDYLYDFCPFTEDDKDEFLYADEVDVNEETPEIPFADEIDLNAETPEEYALRCVLMAEFIEPMVKQRHLGDRHEDEQNRHERRRLKTDRAKARQNTLCHLRGLDPSKPWKESVGDHSMLLNYLGMQYTEDSQSRRKSANRAHRRTRRAERQIWQEAFADDAPAYYRWLQLDTQRFADNLVLRYH